VARILRSLGLEEAARGREGGGLRRVAAFCRITARGGYTEESCGRCAAEVADPQDLCWWCDGPLCSVCWEALGHCGHAEADKANADTARATTWEERHAIGNRRGPKGAPGG
jgi:hypothetical protein